MKREHGLLEAASALKVFRCSSVVFPLRSVSPSCRLQDCVAVNPQDVVDTTDSQTPSEEGELRLRSCQSWDAFAHRSDDVCPCPGAGPR